MHKDGHVGVSLLLYAPLVAVVSVHAEWLLPYALLGALALVDVLWPVAVVTDTNVSFSFAMIPDLDMRVPGVKHRGITHTVWFAGATGAVVAGLTYGLVWVLESSGSEALSPETALLGALFVGGVGVFGVLTHLLGDVMTPMGIRPFAPLSDRHYSLDLWRADSTVANAALYALGVGAVAAAFLFESVVPVPSLGL